MNLRNAIETIDKPIWCGGEGTWLETKRLNSSPAFSTKSDG